MSFSDYSYFFPDIDILILMKSHIKTFQSKPFDCSITFRLIKNNTLQKERSRVGYASTPLFIYF